MRRARTSPGNKREYVVEDINTYFAVVVGVVVVVEGKIMI